MPVFISGSAPGTPPESVYGKVELTCRGRSLGGEVMCGICAALRPALDGTGLYLISKAVSRILNERLPSRHIDRSANCKVDCKLYEHDEGGCELMQWKETRYKGTKGERN